MKNEYGLKVANCCTSGKLRIDFRRHITGKLRREPPQHTVAAVEALCARASETVGRFVTCSVVLCLRFLLLLQKCTRRHNRNVPKGVQRQQIIVAANDGFGSSLHGKLQKFVVVWIAASLDLLDRFNDIYAFDERFKKGFALFRGQVTIKLVTAKYFHQFVERIRRGQNMAVPKCSAKRAGRREPFEECRADERVRIEDVARLTRRH